MYKNSNKIIRGLYLSLLDREPDEKGLQFWALALDSGADVTFIIKEIMSNPEYKEQLKSINHVKNVKSALAKYARTYIKDSPVIIVDVGAQELQDEDHVYAAIDKFTIPQGL